MKRGIDAHVDLILMESHGRKRVDLLKQDVGGLAGGLDSMQRERAKLQLKSDRIDKDLGAGITYYNDGDSLEEMLQYYALQVKNLLRDIESRAETKHYKRSRSPTSRTP